MSHRALRSARPSSPWPSCHVPGLWLFRGSWGGVLLHPGRALYLIKPGTKVDGQESPEPESSAAWGALFSGHVGVAGFGGHVAYPIQSRYSPHP